MNWRTISEILMFVLIIGLVLLCIHYCSRPTETVIETEIQRDTITKTDTIVKYLPSPVKTAYVHDTIVRVDTIEMAVPVVTSEYKDSTYEAVVSGGYFARLERIAVYPKTCYVSEQVTTKVAKKPKISVVVGVGVGYDPVRKQVAPNIGVMVGFPIYNYYGKR